MKKVNSNAVAEELWTSPKGKFACADRNLSIALGREPDSTDLMKRHPFDVEICRVPAGKSLCPYHSHSAQWEFYHVISGRGTVRDSDGSTPSSRETPSFSSPEAPTSSRATPAPTWFSTLSRTTPSAKPATTPTAGNGWFARRRSPSFATPRPITWTGRNSAGPAG